MKFKHIFIHIFFLFFTNIFAFASSTKISGKVIDKETKQPLTGATIYLSEFKNGTTTDTSGNFEMDHLPSNKVSIQISSLGYQTIYQTVDASNNQVLKFELEKSVKEIQEIVITGLSSATEKRRTPTSIATVSNSTLMQQAAGNIIDALATQPGISQITTGAGISKPVIRGLGFNRVVVVNDGIRQEGQQWGSEHGIEIDEFSVNKIEILKGPASLSFGSDAMAGVINMLSVPTLPKGEIKGSILLNYQTNNGLVASSANISGNKNGFIWDVRCSNKMAHAYQNKLDGFVLNSNFKEQNANAVVGLNKSWGYSHLHMSSYYLSPSIIEGERDSLSGNFIKEVKQNDSTIINQIASHSDFKRYYTTIPFQKIYHYKFVLNNNFYIRNRSLKLIIGVQQNRRQEFANALQPKSYELFFLQNTFNYDAKYNMIEKHYSSLIIGVNGMLQQSKNWGHEFLIPQYNLFDAGVYLIGKREIGKFDFSGGLRTDARMQRIQALWLNANDEVVDKNTSGALLKFNESENKFSGISASVGVAYQISRVYFTKLNFSKGYRTPNISELASNGIHEGSNRYEIGDNQLKPENSYQADYTFGLNTKHVTMELSLFNNYISQFIFLRKLNSVMGGDSIMDKQHTFKFQQGHANLYGSEFSIDIHPHPFDWLHFENSFSFVRAQQLHQPDSTSNLPFTPAPRFQSEIKFEKESTGKYLKNGYIKIGIDYNFKQQFIYSAYNTESITESYTLINMGAGADIKSKNKTRCSIYFNVNNLFNVAYQNHLSRLKYTAINQVTQRVGVFNMGRNLSLKILVPFTIKKVNPNYQTVEIIKR